MSQLIDAFRFMELRAPVSPASKVLRRNYIHDDYLEVPSENGTLVRDQSNGMSEVRDQSNGMSEISKIVYEEVFCQEPKDIPGAIEAFVDELLKTLVPYQTLCPTSKEMGSDSRPLTLPDLENRAYIVHRGVYYLLPERLEYIEGLPMYPELTQAFEAIERKRAPSQSEFELEIVVKDLESIFGRALPEIVFQNGVYSTTFRKTKRMLFDTLYRLYMLRRRASVSLEYVIDGLRVLHVVEALAIDESIKTIRATGSWLSAAGQALKASLEKKFPELATWNGEGPLTTFPLIQDRADLLAHFDATPVVHPLFARLHWYKQPFNEIKPIGIGDLKVVKQWLVEYVPGEIAHVENVLNKEVRERIHRRLEKTEETFSFERDNKESSEKDSQTTDRFELKREAENVVKTDLGIGANANLTYNGTPIVASVGATFSYKRDTTDQVKTGETFAREMVTKAAERVEKNVTERRSVTKLFETEETNKHAFDNKEGTGHITGIYRWLDKKYKAQLFNFGKRMMFEFVVPEPAVFFVESRLRAFESNVDCPQPPQPTGRITIELGYGPAQIDKPRFESLRLQYDLAEFAYPEEIKRRALTEAATGNNLFSEKDVAGNANWHAKTYKCRLDAEGYQLQSLGYEGTIWWHGIDENPRGDNPANENTIVISIDGVEVRRRRYETEKSRGLVFYEQIRNMEIAVGNEFTLTLGFWDLDKYDLSFNAELKISDQALLDWQTRVFKKVQTIDQERVNRTNQEAELAYNTRLAEYRNRISQLKATAVNDLLQGRSEAFNREIIRTELKKHCLTMLTREFDSIGEGDVLSDKETVEKVPINFTYRRFDVKESVPGQGVATTECSFEEKNKKIYYPSINLMAAKQKGRYIQFLEQAFEWQQLAYIFYPYFWATRPKWIDLMNRTDDADPNMTGFLQAGSVRVLIAVTPAYEEAALHFLATREPWEGGPAPVIGDPLFIPLHEELRKRQDELRGAVAEGEPWTFMLPTSLVYLEDGGATLPTFPDPPTP